MHSSLAQDGAAETVLTRGQVVRWWELRRLLYNAVLLVIGVGAIAGMEWLVTKAIPFGQDAIEPMLLFVGVVVYGLMANLCYTLGWAIELWGRRSNPVTARRRARWMFKAGMLFSCLLTSVPFWLGLLHWFTHKSQTR